MTRTSQVIGPRRPASSPSAPGASLRVPRACARAILRGRGLGAAAVAASVHGQGDGGGPRGGGLARGHARSRGAGLAVTVTGQTWVECRLFPPPPGSPRGHRSAVSGSRSPVVHPHFASHGLFLLWKDALSVPPVCLSVSWSSPGAAPTAFRSASRGPSLDCRAQTVPPGPCPSPLGSDGPSQPVSVSVRSYPQGLVTSTSLHYELYTPRSLLSIFDKYLLSTY